MAGEHEIRGWSPAHELGPIESLVELCSSLSVQNTDEADDQLEEATNHPTALGQCPEDAALDTGKALDAQKEPEQTLSGRTKTKEPRRIRRERREKKRNALLRSRHRARNEEAQRPRVHPYSEPVVLEGFGETPAASSTAQAIAAPHGTRRDPRRPTRRLLSSKVVMSPRRVGPAQQSVRAAVASELWSDFARQSEDRARDQGLHMSTETDSSNPEEKDDYAVLIGGFLSLQYCRDW